MRRVETEFSTYEIDTVNKRVRRLRGALNPTERQGPDGVWKNYVGLDVVAGRYLIQWDDEGKGTITSRVTHEEEVSPTTSKKMEAVSR